MEKALLIIQDQLIGHFISHYHLDDVWGLYFGKCYLVAQEIAFEEENLFNNWLEEAYPLAKHSVDKEQISKATLLTANMRKEVTSVSLDKNCSLRIQFEKGSDLLVPTDTDIVDWQWGISKSPRDPYWEYIVACFWKGELEVHPDFSK